MFFLVNKNTTLFVTALSYSHFLTPDHIKPLPSYASEFFNDDSNEVMSTGYQGKKKKKVVLLSTKHKDTKIAKDKKKKPASVHFYNATKCGVAVVDNMLRHYSTKSCTRRWPLAVFFDVLDKAGLNSYILFKEASQRNIKRRKYLIYPANEFIKRNNENYNNEFLKEKEVSGTKKRKICSNFKCSNKSRESCNSCGNVVCGRHCKKNVEILCLTCQ